MKILMLSCFALFVGLFANAQDSTYKELLGKYKFPAGSVVDETTVTMENGILTMNSSAGASTLEKVKGDTFNIVSFNGIAVFKRDDTKKITGVHIDASGYVLDGVKEVAAALEMLASDRLMGASKKEWLEETVAYKKMQQQRAWGVCIYN